jgi:hypothetical protein
MSVLESRLAPDLVDMTDGHNEIAARPSARNPEPDCDPLEAQASPGVEQEGDLHQAEHARQGSGEALTAIGG